MSLLKCLFGKSVDSVRPELPVRQDILDREKEFNRSNPSRESWILNEYMYLCEGGLDALKMHPDFNPASQGISYVVAYYAVPEGKKGPCRKVVVSVPLSVDDNVAMVLAENKLKLDLHSRGCNAGIFYKRYKKDNCFYAEAIPATLSGE